MPEPTSSLPTEPRDEQELARTLAAEHEEATVRTSRFMEGEGSSGMEIGLDVSPRTEGHKTEPPPPPAAFALPEPYADRGEIGRGGMGSVHRAFDVDLQREVAIKVMLPAFTTKETLARRFVDEARITALIDHPNIAPVYRLAKAPDGGLSLVMKLIEGRTFTRFLRELPAPPWTSDVMDTVLTIFGKICDATAFAHSRGVIHLDLKPDNVMLGPYGQVYVVDWGIARYRPAGDQPVLLTMSAAAGSSMGTPVYMSPEQALRRGHEISELTDVYLLGGILYQILTGLRPHEGDTLVAVLTSAIKGRILWPSDRAPDRAPPPALAAIAMKALATRPADRYQSVLELQREVAAFQRGEERAPRRIYATGETVIREGESGDEAFAIVSGRCLVTQSSEHRRVVLRELGPGDVFGEAAVFSDEPRSATVEATEPVVVRVVTRETLSQTLGLQTWAGQFIKSLADRFHEADKKSRG